MKEFVFDARDEAATAALGRALAQLLPAGTTVALDGPLGAGKTRLVQAMAAAVGVEPGTAVSPTFVLVQEYHGTRDVIHIDAYRIRDEDEFLSLGVEEYFESEALVLIEWAERVAACLPRERLHVEIAETGDASRRFTISATGQQLGAVVDALAAEAGALTN
ncbi:MAG TPA: tRNA (adenosine(37)-N6)-threonylcarbamoyltransferase complex ATPase subunit type 1 TsaE [Pirellulales bacterium]|nr:tRNA (adenosine(37)-N6)-threonylcarbamoyltransferase complex ATPase subunit type 1 TsaE [Pirellulales bacterium]